MAIPGSWNISREVDTFPDLRSVKDTLKFLDLRQNEISYIEPELLGMLQALKTFQIEGNQLTPIPDVAGTARSLQTLLLTNNPFTSFPPFYQLGGNITKLNIRRTDLTVMPIDQAALLPNLQRLYVADNYMFEFPDLTHLGDTLMFLELDEQRGIKIRYVPAHLLKPLVVIKVLILDGNGLTTLPNITPIMGTLLKLGLAANPLQMSPPQIESYAPMVFSDNLELDVTSTPITSVPSQVCDGYTLDKLSLKGALLVCDCRLRWLKVATLSGLVTDIQGTDTPCLGGPPDLIDVQLDSITISRLQCSGDIHLLLSFY